MYKHELLAELKLAVLSKYAKLKDFPLCNKHFYPVFSAIFVQNKNRPMEPERMSPCPLTLLGDPFVVHSTTARTEGYSLNMMQSLYLYVHH